MTNVYHTIVDTVDEFKDKLTSSEYKKILDLVMTLKKESDNIEAPPKFWLVYRSNISLVIFLIGVSIMSVILGIGTVYVSSLSRVLCGGNHS